MAKLVWNGAAAGADPSRPAIDPASIQVHRIAADGSAIPLDDGFAWSGNPLDRPARVENRVATGLSAARVGRASETADGRASAYSLPRKGRLFNLLTGGTDQDVIWSHEAAAGTPARYAIYFDLMDTSGGGGGGAAVSPAPWIGDADVLREAQGQPLGGFAHFCVTAGDLNGDGLFDLVAGTEKGELMWFPNRGTAGEPRFDGCHLLLDEDGPIDAGWYAAPFVYDWNGDGLPDLLAGTSGNVILWWQNTGTATAPSWEYRGFLQADGKRLEVPEAPVAEDNGGIFARDYLNQPWVGDWDGDGTPDLLTGGYTTGRIFHYRGTSRGAGGEPTLQYVGELEADGEPIDTTWAAAPFAYDVDADGALELFSGSWWWSGIATPPGPGDDDLLFYYESTGPRESPALTRTPLPRAGEMPEGSIARPTVVDWNDDGLPDLLVNNGHGKVYVFLNVGTAGAPRWQMSDEGLTVPWGFVPGRDFTRSWGDVDGDGVAETLNGDVILRRAGSPHAPRLERVGIATVDGEAIDYPGPGYGDPYAYTTLADWDGDGKADLLWGTHQGEVYLHRSLGPVDGQPFAFADGVRLTLKDGEPLRVGPAVVTPEQATDFTTLQGSRIVFLVTDFDVDGLLDLVVTETFGNLWVFRNDTAGGTDTLIPGVKVAATKGRMESLTSFDWDRDGRPDLLADGTAMQPGMLFMNASARNEPAVSGPSYPLKLPYVFWGPRFRVADWNGDGDDDLLIQSEFLSFWVERSFLDHGYRHAKVVAGRDGSIVQEREGREIDR